MFVLRVTEKKTPRQCGAFIGAGGSAKAGAQDGDQQAETRLLLASFEAPDGTLAARRIARRQGLLLRPHLPARRGAAPPSCRFAIAGHCAMLAQLQLVLHSIIQGYQQRAASRPRRVLRPGRAAAAPQTDPGIHHQKSTKHLQESPRETPFDRPRLLRLSTDTCPCLIPYSDV